MQQEKIKKNSYAMELLHTWLEKNKCRIYRFAEMLGCNYMNVWNWSHGLKEPSLRFAVQIEEKTDGYVSPKAWFMLQKRSQPKQKKKKKPR